VVGKICPLLFFLVRYFHWEMVNTHKGGTWREEGGGEEGGRQRTSLL
jgi:hypothetical protein